eukprot:CAMPEP_0184537872 /NCGR_PEP_ID=MMETSP0198_2-20121128/17297_1 /TAXON_ID=1112570 /ORGANISM="Thraustochytrium sp., Strain LLF1b" /LENGTH=83 /DNA_ID=CAMNT_0026931295 /DNA_START=172 /DNA_END=420 /DNA_ORIENTATION=-
MTSTRSHCFTSSSITSKNSLGKDSPKNTTSGFMIPLSNITSTKGNSSSGTDSSFTTELASVMPSGAASKSVPELLDKALVPLW